MAQKIKIGNLDLLCSTEGGLERAAYILYPMDDLEVWIETASRRYKTAIVCITGMDWQNVFSPWPATGVPKGTPDFKGESPEFLQLLEQTIVPEAEKTFGIPPEAERTLFGVSMSGLFAVWQWIESDAFQNIASLSGSFWYEGFVEWMSRQHIQHKEGKAFFLLGDEESKAKVKEFQSVAKDTAAVIELLKKAGIRTESQSVPGDHFTDPLGRLEKAFTGMYLNS